MIKNLLLFCFTFTFHSFAFSAAIEWDGGGDGTSWHDGANWVGDVAPGASDDARVFVAANITVSTTTTIESLWMTHASANVTISSSGNLTIDGNLNDGLALSAGMVTNNGILKIQNIGDGNGDYGIEVIGTLNNNGTLTVQNINNDDGIYVNGGTLNNDEGSITIATTGDFGLSVQNSGVFNNGDPPKTGSITFSGTVDETIRLINGTINNKSGSTLEVTSSGDFGIALNDGSIIDNSGTITISNVPDDGIFIWNSGAASSVTNNSGGQINISSAGEMGFKLDANNTLTNNGTLNITGSTQQGLYAPSSSTVNNDGTLMISGSGTTDIDRVSGSTFSNTSNAVFAPGTSPGTLNVTGDFDFGSSTYNCEINGTTASTQYDVIAVTGTGTIVNGSTKLNLTFGFAAAVNNTFDIITAGTVSGTFNAGDITVNNTGSGNVSTVSLSYPSGTSVRVTVSAILPIELVSFDAREQEDNILLNWQTATETNNEGFEIQWAVGSEQSPVREWKTIGFVSGKGTSFEKQFYSFLHNNPKRGVNYYRLKQFDYDGNFEYSPVESVQLAVDNRRIAVYPNPVQQGELTLLLPETGWESAQLEIFSATGQLVLEQTLLSAESKIGVQKLPKGMYWLEVEADGIRSLEKVMIH